MCELEIPDGNPSRLQSKARAIHPVPTKPGGWVGFFPRWGDKEHETRTRYHTILVVPRGRASPVGQEGGGGTIVLGPPAREGRDISSNEGTSREPRIPARDQTVFFRQDMGRRAERRDLGRDLSTRDGKKVRFRAPLYNISCHPIMQQRVPRQRKRKGENLNPRQCYVDLRCRPDTRCC